MKETTSHYTCTTSRNNCCGHGLVLGRCIWM